MREKVAAILNEIETEQLNFYSLTHRQKAFVHTWLAWQENPGMPMGQEIAAKALSHDSASRSTAPIGASRRWTTIWAFALSVRLIASIFISWLNKLFAANIL